MKDMQEMEQEVRKALGVIVEHRNEPSLNWCVNYARAGMSMKGEELRVQVLYVLGNMAHWHGKDAGWVRDILKAYSKAAYFG